MKQEVMKNVRAAHKLTHIQNWSGRRSVIPAQAGNQGNGMHVARPDSGFRRNDDFFPKQK